MFDSEVTVRPECEPPPESQIKRSEDAGLKAQEGVAMQVALPALGPDTFLLTGDVAWHMVGYALQIGYRHIDIAQEYRNKAEIGDAISGSSVRREDIWLTTKVWPDGLGMATFNAWLEKARAGCAQPRPGPAPLAKPRNPRCARLCMR
jgi:Aldo/keto reductase family